MAERPILFNGAMVRAILSGQKTQTRRPVKGEALDWLGISKYGPEYVAVPGNHLCPFGQPGDRLWVRETWKTHSTFDHLSPREVPPRSNLFYAADDRYSPSAARWRPSIHMPRWACRLVLEITDVRVERLQAISARDCQGEGIQSDAGGGFHVEGGTHYSTDPIESFASLWTSTGGDWDNNPWVWVIEFKRVEAAHG
ncbi:hypothetical protein K1516_07375 [Stenotrophomonas maltophilia]|nr:hypothetical protein K1516_07375 [Stenotrophomonas maltophilia]